MTKSDSGNGWKIALAVSLIGAIATITAALITSTGGDTEQHATPGLTTPSTSDTCLGPPAANVSAFLTDDDVNFEIHISCPPPANSQYVLVGQPRGVDVDPDNPHPEYHLLWEMQRPIVGDYQRTVIDWYYIQTGAEVTYYIISVDDIELAQLQAQKVENMVLKLPQSHTVVSNHVTVKR